MLKNRIIPLLDVKNGRVVKGINFVDLKDAGDPVEQAKIYKHYIYDIEPTKLTKQIEEITNYKIRKQNLADEIYRVENSDLPDKEKQLEKLKKRYTIGNVKFDSVIISDFDESLKSVITSLLLHALEKVMPIAVEAVFRLAMKMNCWLWLIII